MARGLIILGVDPGYGTTGYGLIELSARDRIHPRLLEAGVILSGKKNSLAERLREIYLQLCEILKEFTPAILTMEESFSLKAYPKSSILIGHVQGIVLLAAAEHSLPVYCYYPREIKKALLGKGNATKTQVQKMVQTLFHLNHRPYPDDVSDALAVALCCAQRVRR